MVSTVCQRFLSTYGTDKGVVYRGLAGRELEDDPSYLWRMDQFGKHGGDVVTSDLVIENCHAEADPSRPGVVGEGAGSKDHPSQGPFPRDERQPDA